MLANAFDGRTQRHLMQEMIMVRETIEGCRKP